MQNPKEEMIDVRKSSEALLAKSKQALFNGITLKRALDRILCRKQREARLKRIPFPKK